MITLHVLPFDGFIRKATSNRLDFSGVREASEAHRG